MQLTKVLKWFTLTFSVGSLIMLTAITWGMYLPWQKDNPHMTRGRYELALEEKLRNTTKLTINGDVYNLADYGTPKVIVLNQSPLEWLRGDEIKTVQLWEHDEDKLNKLLRTYYALPTPDAITRTDSKFIYTPSDTSKFFNIGLAEVSIICDEEPNINTSDYALLDPDAPGAHEEIYNRICKYNKFKITYTDGTKITLKDFIDCFDDNYKPDLSNLDLSPILDKLEKSYATTGKTVEFKKHNGAKIDVTYNTYGISFDRASEEEFIKTAITKCKSYTKREPAVTGYDDLNGTYIEVNKEEQKLYYFCDEKLKAESPIVTGTVGVHDTPTGVFYVSEKLPGTTLRGEGYSTWVNRWMRITNSGVGLHDASWRRNFSPNVYQYGGSHGCINLPVQFAYDIYNAVEIGMPVVIY